MATMRDIVTGAATRIRLIQPGDAVDASDAADILQALNDYLASLEGRGLNINWAADLTLNDTFPLADKHIAGMKAMLAERIAEDLGKPVTNILARDARDGWNALDADYRLPDPMRADTALSNMPSQRRII